jgi:hypothetical protein
MRFDMSWKLIVGLVLTTAIWRLDVITSLLIAPDEDIQTTYVQQTEARF